MESELEESASEAEVEKQNFQKEEKKETKFASSHKNTDTPVMASSGIRGHQKGRAKCTEEVKYYSGCTAIYHYHGSFVCLEEISLQYKCKEISFLYICILIPN